MLAVGHVHIADDIDNPAVGFLRQALVLASVSSLHVEDGDVQALGTNHRQTAVCIPQHQYCIGLYLHHQLVALGNDIAHGLTEVNTHGIHVHVGVSELQVLEEHTVKVIVVVLPGVRQQTVEVLAAFVNHCRQADNLRPCTHDDQKLKLPVIFELCHIVYFTGSK